VKRYTCQVDVIVSAADMATPAILLAARLFASMTGCAVVDATRIDRRLSVRMLLPPDADTGYPEGELLSHFQTAVHNRGRPVVAVHDLREATTTEILSRLTKPNGAKS